MGETIEVLIIDESYETRQSVKEMIGTAQGIEVIGEARDGKEALTRLSILSPSIVLMTVPEEVTESLKDLEQIVLRYPQVGIIVLSQHRDWYYVRQYMRVGAKDYLYMPVPPNILIATIEEVHRMDKELHRRNSEAILTERSTQEATILSFVSSRGGVGRTTLAVNLATALAMNGQKTVLIDLDLQSGVDALCLNLESSRTITDLMNDMVEVDPELLRRYLVTHESGLRVLCAPHRPEEMELIKPADIRVIMHSLQRTADVIVIDTSAAINDVLLTILELSHDIFFVNTLSLPTLQANRELLNLLTELNYDISKIHHLVNRASQHTGVTVADVARTFAADIFWKLDDDPRLVDLSLNEGIPFVFGSANHKLSKQIQEFAGRLEREQLTVETQTATRKKGFRKSEAAGEAPQTPKSQRQINSRGRR